MDFFNKEANNQEIIGGSDRKSFFSHIFATTEEGKAELLNVVQYASLGIVPIVILNKLIQRFIPEADTDKSSLEIVAEIFVQIIVMFCGIVFVHRAVTYIPTYSGFKYDNLTLTSTIFAFLMLVLSIQTKLGIKVNILVDRVNELWNGPSNEKPVKKRTTGGSGMYTHAPSQADTLMPDSINSSFPPAPITTSKPKMATTSNDMLRGGNDGGGIMSSGPMAANSLLGSAFGSLF